MIKRYYYLNVAKKSPGNKKRKATRFYGYLNSVETRAIIKMKPTQKMYDHIM